MNTNPRIKIIKPAERRRQREARVAKPKASASRIEQENALEAAATITGWIGEWREHKQQNAETARGFMSLFGEAA
jgi:hypothetical protein